MTRIRDLPPRRGGGLAAALWVCAAALCARAAFAAPPDPTPPPAPTSEAKSPPENNVTFKARLDPVAPESGSKGTLIVDLTLRETPEYADKRRSVHVYADKRFKVAPVESKGVKWGKPVLPPPVVWKDPNLGQDGDNEEVWFDRVTVKIPFEIEAGATFPLTLASNFKWSCCDEGTCYPPTPTKGPVGFALRASGEVLPESGSKDPSPMPPGGVAAPAPNPPAPSNPPDPNPPKEPPPEPADAVTAADVSPAKAASVDFDGTAARVTVVVDASEVKATVTAHEGMHLYPPGAEDGKTVEISGTAPADVKWKELVYPTTTDKHITVPYVVRLPYEGKASEAAPLRFTVGWQSCNEDNCFLEGENFSFDGARVSHLEKPSAHPTPTPGAVTGAVAPPAGGGASAGAIPATGLLFPAIGESEESWFAEMWKKYGILVLGPLFLMGIALAFTPCVLPIIPITVSIIGGGGIGLSRKRLTALLCSYILGLSLAFGTMGVVSAVLGTSMSAAFQSPAASLVISGILFLLGLGMFGIYELQPPQWMQRLQGGAKGGNIVGAFLFGGMAAVIASPCTGPVIVSVILEVAKSGNVPLGFLFFFTLGLGMGSVFFAAGSLNLIMRPGPWMVWVRYGFGIMLVGIALFYLADSGRLVPPLLFWVGFGVAMAIAALVAWHLVKKQGEEVSSASGKAAKIAVLLCVATGAVAWITRPPVYEGSGSPLIWKSVGTREELVAEVEYAKRMGKATLFDITAEWCHNCKAYEKVMNQDEALHARLKKLHLVHVDNTDAVPGELGIREGVGLPSTGQPQMVFLDAKGRIHNPLKVMKWYGPSAAEELTKRLDKIEAASR